MIGRVGAGVAALSGLLSALPPGAAPAGAADGMRSIGAFSIDETEVTVGRFAEFAAATSTVTKAERGGGGLVFAAGWERMAGWTWRAPYGRPALDDEPAVHVTFDEAQAYCRWAGKRLPTEAEWIEAAYTERRPDPPPPFEAGRTYPYPTGETPEGANCLGDCGDAAVSDRSDALARGRGHARAGTTRAGVNGLYDMGANVWEWVETAGRERKGTRGGSWWYGASRMRADAAASKPRDTAAVYIGFRCAGDVR